MVKEGKKRILHIDLDCFFVSVERALKPELNNQPVIVSGNPEGRGVVASASYEARSSGVRSGMPIQKAKKLCPQAIILPVRMGFYADFSERVFEILRNFSPLVEEASIDEAYLDLSGTERLFGPALNVAQKVQKEIQARLDLPCSIGIGANKMVAKIASKLAKPKGILEIKPGEEEEFISDLEIGMIPGVGGKTEQRLKLLGAKKVKHLAQLGSEILKAHFGKVGEELYLKAKGLGDEEVAYEQEQAKSLSKEITFDQDLFELNELEEWLYLLVLKLGIRLRKKGLYANRLTLKFRSSDFTTWTRTTKLKTPSNQDPEIFMTARRILAKELANPEPIRLLGISASELCAMSQLDLFERGEREKLERLFSVLDELRDEFGFDAIYPARLKKILKKGKKENGDED